MSGRNRLPSGGPRRASQRRARPAARDVSELKFRGEQATGCAGRAGTCRRDVGDGEHVEIVIAERVYRVRRAELRAG